LNSVFGDTEGWFVVGRCHEGELEQRVAGETARDSTDPAWAKRRMVIKEAKGVVNVHPFLMLRFHNSKHPKEKSPSEVPRDLIRRGARANDDVVSYSLYTFNLPDFNA
jgi:hypothetical protein